MRSVGNRAGGEGVAGRAVGAAEALGAAGVTPRLESSALGSKAGKGKGRKPSVGLSRAAKGNMSASSEDKGSGEGSGDGMGPGMMRRGGGETGSATASGWRSGGGGWNSARMG